jgi:hypothetical protein
MKHEFRCESKYSPKLLPAGVLDELKLFRSFKSTKQKPAATWLNTTKYYKYSQVLLMISENIARNM